MVVHTCKLRQEDCELKASLLYKWRPSFKTKASQVLRLMLVIPPTQEEEIRRIKV
jgi:hypothetical protein